MNNRKQIIYQFLILFLVAYLCQSSEPYCKVDDNFQNTSIFTTVEESQDYYLDDYFSGYNLSYSLINQDGEEVKTLDIDSNKYSIFNSLDFMSENDQPFTRPIGQDTLTQSDGSIHISILTENEDGFYDVYTGKGEKTITPQLKVINLPSVEGVECFGITKITDSIDVVDCIQVLSNSVQHRCMNYFYLISSVGSHKVTHESVNNCYLNQRPFSRKTIKYQTQNSGFDQIFLLQGIPFDMQKRAANNEDENISYLNIFRYVTDQNEKYPNGRIQINPPLTANTFDLQQNFQIADFDVLGDTLYILDHKLGVVFFKYRQNEITWYKLYLHQEKPILQVSRWGIAVNYSGSTVQMLIAENNQIREYKLNFEEDEPEKILNYPLEHTLTGTIAMDSNSEYIIIQMGRLLNIYNRGNINRKLLKSQIENVDLYYLWYSDNLYVINKSGIYEYFLQYPTIHIKGYKEAKNGNNIKIKATSRDFFNTQSCILELNSIIIKDKFTKKAYKTNYPHHIEFSYQSSYQTYIPLEIFWVGPNLNYQAFHVLQENKKNDQKFLQQSEDSQEHTIYEDLPKIAQISYDDGDIKNTWYYTEIIPSKLNPKMFLSIHQNYQNVLHIYECWSNVEEPSNVNCNIQIVNEELEGRIQSISIGEWGNLQNIMAIVFQDQEQYVHFYFVESQLSGSQWFQLDINQGFGTYNKIIDIELNSNSLYCVIQDRNSRYVEIFSFIKSVQNRGIINSQTIQDWPSVVAASDWYPERIYSNEAHPNVIFIQSRKQVFIVSTQSHTPMYLDMIPLQSEIGAVIDVTPRSFIIAYQDGVITDYSLQNMNWVSLKGRFEYPTYGYEFVYPFSFTAGEHSGLVYVLAFEPQTTNLKCMIFQSGHPSIQTLYKIVDIEDDIPIKTNNFSIAAGGNQNVDYVFIQYGDKKFYIRTPVKPKLIITPHLKNQHKYVDNIDLQLLVQEWSGDIQAVVHEVKIVNGQTDIIINNNVIENELPKTIYVNGQNSSVNKYMTYDWWSGAVISIDLVCEPNPEYCENGNIYAEGPVIQDKLEKDAHDLQGIIDIKYSHNQKQVYIFNQETNKETGQYENIIRIYDNSLRYVKNYNQINKIWGCQHMDLNYDSKGKVENIFVYCFDWEAQIKWDLYIVTEDEIKKIYLPNVNIEKGQTQYFQDKLYVNNLSDDAHQGVYVFDVSKAKNIKQKIFADGEDDIDEYPQATQLQHFNYLKPYFQQNARFTSFIVTEQIDPQIKNNYVKLILSNSPKDEDKDIKVSLVFLNLNIKNNYEIDKDGDTYQFEELDFDKFVIQHRQFINEKTQLKYLKFKELQLKADDTVKITILVMTDNTAIYETDLIFSINQKDQEAGTIFEENLCKIKAAYNNYGVNIPYSQIELFESTVAVGYFNDITKRTTVVFYENINIYSNDIKKEENVLLHSIKGGHLYQQTFEEGKNSNIAYAIFRKPNGSISLASNDISPQEKLISLEYKPERLNIITNGEFEEQQIKIKLVSDYSKEDSYFSTDINPDSEFNNKGGGGDGWKIALGITIPLLVIIGALLFYFLYYKKKKENEFYTLNENPTSEDGFSMQQPLKKA